MKTVLEDQIECARVHSRGGIDYDKIVREKLFSQRSSVDPSICHDTQEDYNYTGNTHQSPIKNDRRFIERLNQTADRFGSGFKNKKAASPMARPKSNLKASGEKLRSGTAVGGQRQKRPGRFAAGLAINLQTS